MEGISSLADLFTPLAVVLLALLALWALDVPNA